MRSVTIVLAIVLGGCTGPLPPVNLIVRVVNGSRDVITVRWDGPATGTASAASCQEWDNSFPSGHWVVQVVTPSGKSATFSVEATDNATVYAGFKVLRDGSVVQLTPAEAEVPPSPCGSGGANP